MSNGLTHSVKIGTVLSDKWIILEFIAKGAMGEVYRAHQLNLKRDVAIKVIASDWLQSLDDDVKEIETTLQRFRREVQAMAQIRHPNVIDIFDHDSTFLKKGNEDIALEYIAMEYIPGNTLRSTMSEEGCYPDEVATRDWLNNYFLPVLDGVRAMHEQEIVHRDLKPENILMDGDTPKIADFGLARSRHFKLITQSVDTKGTPPYMSPEHFFDFKRADEKSDIYSLGKILFEAIDGKLKPKTIPFKSVSLQKTGTLFFQKLDQIVRSATAEDINERVRSVEEFKKLLLEAINLDFVEKKSKAKQWQKETLAVLVAVLVVAWGLRFWKYFWEHHVYQPPAKPSIAVLPFDNMSGDPKQEFLADGISENIITSLSKNPEMSVIARSSTFTYRGQPVKVQQIGKELGVRYVLEGSIQRDGDRLRVTAQLIDTKTGSHIWSERYDRELKDVLAVQDEISANILSALRANLVKSKPIRAP